MNRSITRAVVTILTVLILAGVVAPLAHARALEQTPPKAPAGQSEFVPIDELPPAEQMSAAPLLIAAYAVVWIALLIYVWSVWRRLGAVEREIAEVARRIESGGRRS